MARPKALNENERANVIATLKVVVARFPNQREAAKAIGSTQQTISRVLGGGEPGVGLTRLVAKYLSLSFEALVGSDGEAIAAKCSASGASSPRQQNILTELRAIGLDAEIFLRSALVLTKELIAERDALRARVAKLEARLGEGS